MLVRKHPSVGFSFRDWGSGSKIKGVQITKLSLKFRVRVQGQGSGFRVSGFRVRGLGFRVQGQRL
jgi:hypothetical protein